MAIQNKKTDFFLYCVRLALSLRQLLYLLIIKKFYFAMKTNKMRRKSGLISIVWLIAACFALANPEKKTISIGGLERDYFVYEPSHPNTEKANGIIVCLHGFSRTMNDFFEGYNITGVADLLNMIIIAPQALPEQDQVLYDIVENFGSLIDSQLSLHSVWGCGLSVQVSLGQINMLKEELNRDVDDVSFIDCIIDETLSEYDIQDENIFMLGTSMGGYMTYQYALIHGERLSGIISIAGSMGLNIKGIDNKKQVPVCDFHSITDEVVPYKGSYTQNLFNISLAMPMPDVINYWRETNSTGDLVTEQVEYYPSTNGITVEKFTYPDPENEVIHYKIDGAPHSYFFSKENGDCMDHVEEIIKFLQAHLSEDISRNPVIPEQKAFFYPNPVYNKVYMSETTGIVMVYDITGSSIFTQSFTDGQVDLSFLKPGVYVIRIQSRNSVQTARLIKK